MFETFFSPVDCFFNLLDQFLLISNNGNAVLVEQVKIPVNRPSRPIRHINLDQVVLLHNYTNPFYIHCKNISFSAQLKKHNYEIDIRERNNFINMSEPEFETSNTTAITKLSLKTIKIQRENFSQKFYSWLESFPFLEKYLILLGFTIAGILSLTIFSVCLLRFLRMLICKSLKFNINRNKTKTKKAHEMRIRAQAADNAAFDEEAGPFTGGQTESNF